MFCALLLLLSVQAPTGVRPELRIEGPPGLAAEKSRLEALDRRWMDDVVRLVGLRDPGPPIPIELAATSSEVARSLPSWIAGFAVQDHVVIFPARSPSYPDNTLDDVLRHEVAHAMIWRATSGRPIPRWFNEGLAMAAERRLGLRTQTQVYLQLLSGSRLSFPEIDHLFKGQQSDQTRAYALSGAIVQDLLSRHGEAAGGRILGRVSRGASFESAFGDVIGHSTKTEEGMFWNDQRLWTRWLTILVSQETLWIVITLLALLAIWRKRRQGAEIRKRWEEEEREVEARED